MSLIFTSLESSPVISCVAYVTPAWIPGERKLYKSIRRADHRNNLAAAMVRFGRNKTSAFDLQESNLLPVLPMH